MYLRRLPIFRRVSYILSFQFIMINFDHERRESRYLIHFATIVSLEYRYRTFYADYRRSFRIIITRATNESEIRSIMVLRL